MHLYFSSCQMFFFVFLYARFFSPVFSGHYIFMFLLLLLLFCFLCLIISVMSSAYPNFNMLKRAEISVSLLYYISPALGKLSSLKKALNKYLLDKWIISPSLQLDCKCLKRQKPYLFSSLSLQYFARDLGHYECSQGTGGVRNGQSHTPMSQAAV